eukprot:15655-Heterococcus_DN1.PRE.1
MWSEAESWLRVKSMELVTSSSTESATYLQQLLQTERCMHFDDADPCFVKKPCAQAFPCEWQVVIVRYAPVALLLSLQGLPQQQQKQIRSKPETLPDEHNALESNFEALLIHQDAKTRAQKHAHIHATC